MPQESCGTSLLQYRAKCSNWSENQWAAQVQEGGVSLPSRASSWTLIKKAGTLALHLLQAITVGISCQLTQTYNHLGRGNINWRISLIRLICGHMCEELAFLSFLLFCFVFGFSQTVFLCVALLVLKLSIWTSRCLCLPSAGIKGAFLIANWCRKAQHPGWWHPRQVGLGFI